MSFLLSLKSLFVCAFIQDVESYIHRSGRTGRAGRTGVCICFYQRKEEDQLRYVENKAVSVCCHELSLYPRVLFESKMHLMF